VPRCRVVNDRPQIQELDRIRRDIGVRLRTEYAVDPAPQSLVALLKELEIRVRHGELDRRFAEVDQRVAELLHAVGLRFPNTCGANDDDPSVTDASQKSPGQRR
jgi:hypothetical protein